MKVNEYKTKTGKRIRLFNGDCMKFMEDCDTYDLAIVDPPYGIGESRKAGNRPKISVQYKESNWDDEPETREYFSKSQSISKNQIIWGANHFIENLSNANSSCWVVWDKVRGSQDFADCELAWTSFSFAVKKITFAWDGFRQGYKGRKEKKIHPTQKPVALYRWLLQNYAEEDDTILDTHGGSMSLAIACYIEDFALDIIELDEDYYNDAVQRFENHISQKTLF